MRPPPTPLASGEIPVAGLAQTFLYRLHDSGGDLLYVGITDDLCQRLETHRRTKDWFPQVRSVTWESFRLREEAEYAESYWIAELAPQHNLRDNHRRLAARALGHRTTYAGAAWRRLGQTVRAAREGSRVTQKSFAKYIGVGIEVVRSLERGEQIAYGKDQLDRLERALDWRGGSIESVLAGGEPDPMSDLERTALTAGGG